MFLHSMFPGGHGKTATVEHHNALMDDLEAKVFGRLGNDTNLGNERPHLQQWRDRGW